MLVSMTIRRMSLSLSLDCDEAVLGDERLLMCYLS